MIRFARTSCAKKRAESRDLIRASINLAFVKSKLIKFSRCDFLNKTLTNGSLKRNNSGENERRSSKAIFSFTI